MPGYDEPAKIRPSVLDRLIDDDPGAEIDPPVSPRKQFRELRASIRRDLSDLLNSRRRCLSFPPALKALESSILEFGIRDLNATRLGTEDDREELLEEIEQTIQRFEPRFKSIRITSKTHVRDRNLAFRIDAVVYADPAPEEVAFDSVVEPVVRSVAVKAES